MQAASHLAGMIPTVPHWAVLALSWVAVEDHGHGE